ncbi:hypothetical protein GGQ73_002751 [Rhizobium skierniewicense]|uniref:Uncharacterized protein n=1 Tax=Rhizobium skierniewicense TaxID=984260 RepID=A0A7W6C6R9_9HYPH|nr:hypothetical protein [Rhizobium skierniewicense]MBB3946797.1 hypothetical protein [Rhizobium skierniewicense]
MKDRQTPQTIARIVYFVEILVFAAPFYLTYGILAVISAPYAGLLILFSPAWLMAYLMDANGEFAPVILVGTIVIAIAALSLTGVVALWKLAKLSHIYMFKGAEALSKHHRDLRIGLFCGLAPLIFTTTVMAAIAVSDGGWTSLPFAIIGGGTLLIPVAHLWLAMPNAREKLGAGTETPLLA